jgi:hypothetical protein
VNIDNIERIAQEFQSLAMLFYANKISDASLLNFVFSILLSFRASSVSTHVWCLHELYVLRRTWRKQRGNQNPYIEEAQTTQCPKEKGGLTQVLQKGRQFCSTSDTRCVNSVTNPVISHEWGKNREVNSVLWLFYLLKRTYLFLSNLKWLQ